MQRLINNHVEASKIGRQIAEQVMDSHRRGDEASSGSSPGPDSEPSVPVANNDVSKFSIQSL